MKRPKKQQSAGIIRMITLLMIVTSMVTCNRLEDEITMNPLPDPIKKVKNPFSTENIATALKNVAARAGGRTQIEPPSTTHNYVRFEPQNLDQIMLLQDLGYDLWDEPLDQEIDYVGDYYQQPGLPDSLNYFYTLIPANYTIVQSVPHTIISQVVLFDEDAGDEQDPEEDPWIPDPDNCPDPYNPNCPCIEGACARLNGDYTPDVREDLLQKTTRELLDAGINLVDLYNEAMVLAGYPHEVIDRSSGRVQCSRCYPAGRIMVRDNSSNTDVPVKSVKVKAKRWFKLKSSYTDAGGNFYIDKGFKHKAKVIVKFKNGYSVVRGINGALKLWQYVFPLKKKLGVFEEEEMENINYTFQYASNANHLSALQFAAAHCMSTLQDMRQNCVSNNIQAPLPGDGFSLNIWISSVHTQSAAAPMLRSIINTSQLIQAIQYTFPGVVSNAITVLKKYVPDVTMRLQDPNTGSTRFAVDINRTFFHEFGHAIHYNKVGNAYWADLITAIVSNGGYGTKTSTGHGHIAVAESWGFFIGPTFTRSRYISIAALAEAELKFLEYQRRNDNTAVSGFNSAVGFSSGWIPWGMHHDLIDTGEPAISLINDQCNGYTISGVFKGFHSGSTTVQNLKAVILANNGNLQSSQVNNLVTSYGW